MHLSREDMKRLTKLIDWYLQGTTDSEDTKNYYRELNYAMREEME